MNLKITVIETKCGACGQKLRALTKEELEKKLHNHVYNDCPVIKTLEEWDKAGVRKEMFQLLKTECLVDDLKKLMKKRRCTKEELIEILNSMEVSEG